MPDMSQREGMERPEGMTGGGGMSAMNIPEGMEFPEDFETMSSEEKMAVMSEMGIEIPDTSEREALRGEMNEGATRPNMEQGENEPNGQNLENPPTEATQTSSVEGESLVSEEVSISENTFELILTDGSSKTIVIPKELGETKYTKS